MALLFFDSKEQKLLHLLLSLRYRTDQLFNDHFRVLTDEPFQPDFCLFRIVPVDNHPVEEKNQQIVIAENGWGLYQTEKRSHSHEKS